MNATTLLVLLTTGQTALVADWPTFTTTSSDWVTVPGPTVELDRRLWLLFGEGDVSGAGDVELSNEGHPWAQQSGGPRPRQFTFSDFTEGNANTLTLRARALDGGLLTLSSFRLVAFERGELAFNEPNGSFDLDAGPDFVDALTLTLDGGARVVGASASVTNVTARSAELRLLGDTMVPVPVPLGGEFWRTELHDPDSTVGLVITSRSARLQARATGGAAQLTVHRLFASAFARATEQPAPLATTSEAELLHDDTLLDFDGGWAVVVANTWVRADGGVRVDGLSRRTEHTLTNQTRVAQLTHVSPVGRSVLLRVASLDGQPVIAVSTTVVAFGPFTEALRVEADGGLSPYLAPDSEIVEPPPDAGPAHASLRVGTACDTGSGFSVALALLLVLRRGGLSRR